MSDVLHFHLHYIRQIIISKIYFCEAKLNSYFYAYTSENLRQMYCIFICSTFNKKNRYVCTQIGFIPDSNQNKVGA